MNDKIINSIVYGQSSNLTDEAKQRLELSLRTVMKGLEDRRNNTSSRTIFGRGSNPNQIGNNRKIPDSAVSDAQMFTSLSDMINGNNRDPGGFQNILDQLVNKNKKYFSVIKDYELMPILIPQINRVLMFLVNECLSPDVQNEQTFLIKYIPKDDPHQIQRDIDDIKKEMKLDNLLREVYTNRFKLGHEYYLVLDYQQVLERMERLLQRKSLNESTAGMTDSDFFQHSLSGLSENIGEIECSIRINQYDEVNESGNIANDLMRSMGKNAINQNVMTSNINETVVDLSFGDMNIIVERSGIGHMVEQANAMVIQESSNAYSIDTMLDALDGDKPLNEAIIDNTRFEQVISNIKSKKLQRCVIERMDPARVFKLKVAGKTIGYFYIRDIDTNGSNVVNFAQSLKDQLLKSRAVNIKKTSATAEEVISRSLAEKIINTFDPNIGINRIEDVDLLIDYIRNNEIFRGNKRITFYYSDEIFDCSRADGSILTNAVFFTKLYSTLLLNNIMTKVLRGRGRQIHTVRMGASPNVQRYIQNAMASLTMPENNLGTLHGSFEQILNPFNAASDIIIPTEDDSQKYIETDYIPGQDVNMDDDFLRTLLNAIISSFGLDSAVIDATNGNLQFARTLSMESLQIANMVRNEQQDLYDAWSNLCKEIIRIMGSEETVKALERSEIEVAFFEPHTLITQTIIDDINQAKTYAEGIADLMPELNGDNTENQRSKFIFELIKKQVNIDWSAYTSLLSDAAITNIGDEIEREMTAVAREYKESTEERDFDPNAADDEFSAEEEEILNTKT